MAEDAAPPNAGEIVSYPSSLAFKRGSTYPSRTAFFIRVGGSKPCPVMI
jgi:hypothetical protein